MIIDVCESFRSWKMDSTVPSRPPNPLLVDFQPIFPNFIKEDAEEIAREFDIPKIMQATFYATTINDAIELGVLS